MPEFDWLKFAHPLVVPSAAPVESYTRILEVLPTSNQPGISRDRIRERAKTKLSIGKNKADSWLALAIEDGFVERLESPKPGSSRTEALFRRKESDHGK